jgi:predicted ATPase/class 3 adenylate cyclase
MSGLPSGTVTFLFTDIEGSTRLLRRLGERYAEVVGRHDRVVRAACAGHGGREISTQGDAFFVAFPRAGDAVAAAVQVQRALAVEPWPEDASVRVRMGLHTGEPMVGATDYIGLAVHRAARICAVGHGGQILLSSATRELLEDDLAPTISLRDLGEQRLKDFDRPEHLFQVVVGDLPADFPPPVSVAVSFSRSGGADGGLAPPPNRTVGRAHDVRAIGDRLRVSTVRLLTLTGPGGVGKTRLAVEAGRAVQADFADGARFVALAAVSRPEDVPSAIVQALAIVSVSGETSQQAVTRFLGAKDLLLVLDNVEHVLPAARFVSELLVACSGLTVLATSREPLALHAEHCYPVAPLGLPQLGTSEDLKTLSDVEAVALFLERAQAHDPDFCLSAANATAVAEICRRVDGLPLAIELAAARCGLLSPREIAQRLDAAIGALGGGTRDAPARQQTLRATIDWSHDLLSEPAKTCFARFGVFAGGATLQASETITGADIDTLDDLVAKNLLVRHEHPHAETRLGMLETIRAYAGERFAAAADRDAVRERHFRHFLALAERHATERALWSAERNEHLRQLDAESDNLHAALAWAVREGSAGRAISMAGAIAEYWQMRSRPADAVNWIDQVLTQPGADAYPALRVRLLTVKAMALWDLGRAAEQPAVWAEAEAVARALGDPVILSRALQPRVTGESLAHRLDVAEALADEALHWATTARDHWEIAMAALGKAMAAATIADLRERTDRAASLLDEVGNVFHLATLLASAAYAAMGVGSDRDAKALVERAIPIARRLDDPSLWMMVHGDFGLAALLTGDIDAAREAFREELRLGRELVARPFAYEGLSGLAAVAATRGEPDRAARLAGAAGLGQRHAPEANATPSVTAACCAGALRCGAPYAVVEDRLDATFFEAARTSCGLDAWNAAADEGAALSFDDAIAYALQEPRA